MTICPSHSNSYPVIDAGKRRGSALLAVVLFIIFAIAILATMLPSLVTEYRMNVRHRVDVGAFAAAEYGARHAIWCLNELPDEAAWEADGWRLETDSLGVDVLIREMVIGEANDTAFRLEGSDRGRIRIVVRATGLYTAQVISEGRLTRGSGGESGVQLLSITLGTTSPFLGLIAKESLSFQGQPRFDSFNSDVFPFYYSSGVNSGNNVTVGSVSNAPDSVSLGNAHVFGNVVSGAADPVTSGAVTGGRTITGEIIGDFNQELPPVNVPDTTGWLTSF